MTGEKDSRLLDFSTEERPFSSRDVARLLRALSAACRQLRPLVDEREQWERQGLTKVPNTHQKSRRKAFRDLSRAAPSILSDLPRLSSDTLRARMTHCDSLAAKFDRGETRLEDEADHAIIDRALFIAAWKRVLAEPQTPLSRREQTTALVSKWKTMLAEFERG